MIERHVTVLGSTGSVGCSTLDLMDQAEQAGSARFTVEALTGGRNVALLAEQVRRWNPRRVVIADEAYASDLDSALGGHPVEIATGDTAIVEAASQPADL